MKNFIWIKPNLIFSTLQNNIYYYILLLLSISIPYNRNASGCLIGILILNWLTLGNFKQNLRKLGQSKMVFLFCSVFIVQLIGLIYSKNLSDGLFTLEKTSSLIIFPIIIYTSPKFTFKQISNILTGFIWSCTIGVIICLLYATYKNHFLESTEWILFTSDLLKILGITHVYFGMYLVFAFFLTFNSIINTKTHKLTFPIYFFNILTLIIGIVLLIPKTSIIALIFITLFIVLSLKKRDLFISGSILVAFIALFVFFSLKIPNIKNRIKNYTVIFSDFSDINNDYWDYKSSRLGPTMCSLEIIKENFPFGVGIGDARNAMENCYIKHDLSNLVELNSHNQYLHYMLSTGILGILCFISSLFIPLIISIKKRTIIYTVFLLLFIICNLTENMMVVNKGVVFYSFFNSLLAFHLKKT